MTSTVMYTGRINASQWAVNVTCDASGNIFSKRLKSSSFVNASTQKMERNPNMIYIKINFAYNVLRMLSHLKFVTNSPNSTKAPGFMVLDFLAQTLDVYVYGTGIADIFISPNLV